MGVYNILGNLISPVYDGSGDTLANAYDVSGNEIYTQEQDEIALTDIVSYYRQDTEDAVTMVNALPSECIAFIVLADTHSSSNSQNSQNIVRYLLKNSKADKCFLLGDYSGNLWNETEYITYATPLATNCASKVYATLGNHEWFGNGGYWSNLEQIYNDFLADKTQVHGDRSHYYYYFDDTAHKIRYVVLNTAEGSMTGFSATQESWLKTDALQLPGTDWKAVVFGHHSLVGDDGVFSEYSSPKTSEIITAFNLCNGTIVGYFHGHEHNDWVYTSGSGAVKCISLACDTRSNSKYYANKGCPYPDNRTAGTTNEQAITIVMINTTTKAVTFKRIGAIYMQEADMAFTY